MPNSNVAVGLQTVGPLPTYYDPTDVSNTGVAYASPAFAAGKTNSVFAVIGRSDDVTKEFCSIGLDHTAALINWDYNVAVFECDVLPTGTPPTTTEYMQLCTACVAEPYNVNYLPSASSSTPAFRAKGKFLIVVVTATTADPGAAVAVKLYEWNDRDGRYKD